MIEEIKAETLLTFGELLDALEGDLIEVRLRFPLGWFAFGLSGRLTFRWHDASVPRSAGRFNREKFKLHHYPLVSDLDKPERSP
jgi:hypothetical protein